MLTLKDILRVKTWQQTAGKLMKDTLPLFFVFPLYYSGREGVSVTKSALTGRLIWVCGDLLARGRGAAPADERSEQQCRFMATSRVMGIVVSPTASV